MDPILIYNSNLQFQDNKLFTINFRDEDRLHGVLFKKNKDYYLTSMSCFIEITNDLSEQQHYGEIIKQIFEENDRKNVILFKYRNQIYPFKLKITKAYFEKIKK